MEGIELAVDHIIEPDRHLLTWSAPASVLILEIKTDKVVYYLRILNQT
jgi:hypothetical protein